MYKIKRILRYYKEFIFFITVTVVSFVILFTVIIPLIKNIIQEYSDLVLQETGNEALRKKTDLFASLDEETLQEEYGTVQEAILVGTSVAPVMQTLESLAEESGVIISSYSIERMGTVSTSSAKLRSGDEQKIGAGIITSNIIAEGSIQNIKDFLEQLEKTRVVMRVKNFDLSFAKKSGLLRSQLSIDSYYMAPILSAVASSDTLTLLTAEEENMISTIRGNVSYVSQLSVSVEQVETPSSSVRRSEDADPFSL